MMADVKRRSSTIRSVESFTLLEEAAELCRLDVININKRLLLVVGLAAAIVLALGLGLYFGLRETGSDSPQRDEEVFLRGGAVTSNGLECAAIGEDILRKNGSAADAAIAVLFCEGVTCPQSAGLGGGFFLTIYDRATKTAHTLDARETAPAAATKDMYVNNQEAAVVGGLAVAVPGEIKGYWELHKRYGKLDWKTLIDPTIKLCREGHVVSGYLDRIIRPRRDRINAIPSLKEVFINPETGETWKEGERIKRLALADSLEVIASEGVDSLYSRNGTLLPKLMRDLKEFGSIITEDDIVNYQVRWLPPAYTELKGNYHVYSMPLPGSGHVLNYMLNILDGYDELRNDPLTWHRIVEAFKHGYGLRTHLGDPAFVPGIEELIRKLTNKNYAAFVRDGIWDNKTFQEYEHYGAEYFNEEDHGTAHVSILAPNGDAVAVTSTINYITSRRKKFLAGSVVTVIIAVLLIGGLYIGFFHDAETATAASAHKGGGAVAANGHECAAIGANILRVGGSAADAAIATLFCEGVTCPQSMGLGGGFILTIYDAAKNHAETLNARETAPAAATVDMLVQQDDSSGKDKRGLVIAVPGELKGYWVLHQRYGKLNWSALVQPTIDLCRNGHMVTKYLGRILSITEKKILAEPSLREIFINPATNGTWKEGQYIKRLALADGLEIIAKEGVHALYSKNGTLLPKLMQDLKGFDSILTEEDFYNYEPKWERPATATLRGGSEVHSFPLPGSGTLLNFMLRVLDGYEKLDPKDTLTWHRIVEAFKWGYGLRTRVGDPHYVAGIAGLTQNLTSDSFAAYIRSKIDDNRTFSEYSHYGAEFGNVEDHGTAHVSVLAANGDAVAATSTINYLLGAKIRSRLTGIILNDEMDDFGSPNSTNTYGLPPSPANMIAPGKRPLSSMAPTIVTSRDGSGVRMVVGGAGGSRITTATALLILRHVVFGEELNATMAAPRLHHQLAPMAVEYEPGFDEPILEGLRQRGHVVKEKAPDAGFAAATAISRDASSRISGAFDPRRGGSLEIL
ncbi:glutathione hydrolase 1 proenzyme-like [Uranotaenia lowii]|uniref:glutathione hydrolase 1 proenzyme-like n=1 Tax=Uranotaenia lowii TaxID=190385 RepID=UPI0024785447|nr:glutathione hydrolase 1 proenzyme-like [Uranotaenia lowii]